MNTILITTIAIFALIFSGIISTFIFHKYNYYLRGNVGIIGILGLISQIGFYGLLAIYTNIYILIVFVVIIFPTGLNYLYFLVKYKREKREFLNEKR